MPGVEVTVPGLLDPGLVDRFTDLVYAALARAVPRIENLMKGGMSRVPIDTGRLRREMFATIGARGSRYEALITLWWETEYAAYLIEHAGIWRAHAPGTLLDWRNWAIRQSLAVIEEEITRGLISAGFTAEWIEATR